MERALLRRFVLARGLKPTEYWQKTRIQQAGDMINFGVTPAKVATKASTHSYLTSS